MDISIKIKAFYPKLAISEQGDFYTWLPLPDEQNPNEKTKEHLFPVSIPFRLPKNATILGVDDSEIIILNENNEVIFFDIIKNIQISEPFHLIPQGKAIVQIKVSSDLNYLLLLNDDQTLLMFQFENQTSSKNKGYTKQCVELKDLTYKVKGNINAVAVGKHVFAVLTNNTTLTLLGNSFFYSKHKRTTANKLDFKLKNESFIKDMHFADKKLAFTLHNNQIVYNTEELDMQTPVEFTQRISLKKFSEKWSNLNTPSLHQNFFISDSQEVFFIEKNEEIYKLQPININLSAKERIIDVKALKSSHGDEYIGTAFALTDKGNLYGFGKNDKFQLGVDSFSFESQAIHINPVLGKIITDEVYYSILIDYFSKHKNLSYELLQLIPITLKNNHDLIFKILIATNFDNRLRDYFDFNYELLNQFIKQRPDLKYSIIKFNYWEFVKKSEIEYLSELFPEIIFLFYKEELSLPVFEKYLLPFFSRDKSKSTTAQELNKKVLSIMDYEIFNTSCFDDLSFNFQLALINLGFKYDFLSYEYLHTTFFKGWNKDRIAFFTKIPAKIKEKIFETCDIRNLPKNISMNELVRVLVEQDAILLAERLIKSGMVTKSKFLKLLSESPSIFSIGFKSSLLASPKVERPKKVIDFNFNELSQIRSFKYLSYFFDGERLFVSGSKDVLSTNRIKTYRSPYPVNDLINDFSNTKIVLFSSNDRSYIILNEKKEVFLGGSIVRTLDLKPPKESKKYNDWFEMTKLIHLNSNEWIAQVKMPTNETIIFLTNQSRVLFACKESSFIKKNVNSKASIFSIHDLTTQLGGIYQHKIIRIEAIDDEHLLYQTNQGELYFYREGSIAPIQIKLSHGEKIIDFKLGELGLLVFSSLGKLWSTQILVDNITEIQNWNQFERSSQEPYNKIFTTDLSNLEELKIPLEKTENITQFDINFHHAMVITSSGRVFLWGEHQGGALGIIPFRFTNILDLSFLKKDEKVVKGFLGHQKTYLLTNKNRLFGFGSNLSGSLGDGTEVDRYNPVDLTNKFKR
jgi:hypothetical protein